LVGTDESRKMRNNHRFTGASNPLDQVCHRHNLRIVLVRLALSDDKVSLAEVTQVEGLPPARQRDPPWIASACWRALNT
jgi:hypothetical protein